MASYLGGKAILKREGHRPTIMPRYAINSVVLVLSPNRRRCRPLPQRQVPTLIPVEIYDGAQSLVSQIQAAHPDLVALAPSRTEGGTTQAIYAQPHLATLNETIDPRSITGLEIAHCHPQDASFHVSLSPKDAGKLVEMGWGERFPLTAVPTGWVRSEHWYTTVC